MNVSIEVPTWAKWIISDFSDWDRNPQLANELAPQGLWIFELPENGYLEYAFIDAEGTLRADPANQHVADNPWTKEARAIYGAAYVASPYVTQLEGVRAGEVRRFRVGSSHLASPRRFTSYTPLGYETTPLPIILLQDGPAYHRFARLHLTLEKLLTEAKIRPSHLVFIEPIDRSLEYPYYEPYQHFVIDEVIPLLDKELSTTGERIAMGASLGGLVSSLLVWNYPEMFQTLVTQSGAFLGSPLERDWYRGQSSWLLQAILESPKRELRCYLDVGTFEWLYPIHLSIAEALAQQGYDFEFHTRAAGHNWVNWRNGFADALAFGLKR